MQTISKESEIIEILKDKLNIDMDEATKIFSALEEKISDKLDYEQLLNVVKTVVTKHPIKSVLIAVALGVILAKFLRD